MAARVVAADSDSDADVGEKKKKKDKSKKDKGREQPSAQWVRCRFPSFSISTL